jgi:hypothetical protein
VIRRLASEPALVVGVVTSGIGLAVLFGVDLSNEQVGGIVTFLGAIMALVRFLTTPSSQVLAQVKPSGEVVAGQATTLPTGSELGVDDRGDMNPSVLLPLPIDPDAP